MNVTMQLKALTDIWTGDVECKPGKLKMTGIKGSIRWWYEALLRGLDIYACDPRIKNKELRQKLSCEFNPETDNKTNPQKICPACEMFGCTGWGAKFNLRIMDRRRNGTAVSDDSQIKKGETFTLEFIERKKMTPIEKNLLEATIHLIVEYGAIGGKTAWKPSDHNHNDKAYHRDYGILGYNGKSPFKTLPLDNTELEKLRSRLADKKANAPADWPNLRYFLFAKEVTLERDKHNALVCRDISKGRYKTPDRLQVFLGGYIKNELNNSQKEIIAKRETDSDSESKKIFSFHGEDSSDAKKVKRTFAYTGKNDTDYKFLQDNLNCNGDAKTGTYTLTELFDNTWGQTEAAND